MRATETRARVAEPASAGFKPEPPLHSADTGLDRTFLTSLVLKMAYFRHEITERDLSREIKLPPSVIDEQLSELRREEFVEVLGPADNSRVSYRFRITARGSERARQALEVNRYVGPAPVSLEQYVAGLAAQTEQSAAARRSRLQQAISHLVLRADVLRQVGPAFESGRALFLYGSPGNGKTVLAAALGAACGDPMLIPHAVAVDGQVIRLLDPIVHGVTPSGDGQDQPSNRKAASVDHRWVKVKRPVVLAGGELDLTMLELTFNEREGHHEAPLHMKASGGVLIIDDFGRQVARPRDLLNRWIVPLDKGVDYLTLHTGKKFPVPFTAMVVFATNLDPHDLVDEAFLRRIPYKVELPSPDHDEYCEIFTRACGDLGLEPNLAAIDHIYHRFYVQLGMEPRSCHPRDILQKLIELAQWENVPPQISPANLDHVCRSYFLED